ncbi:MAG TPA: lysophospholipid acyltransferase family protein [Caulifigura sp.]|nr:lysophospholipid acyltransferase family protein [Caulifigura sp.]
MIPDLAAAAMRAVTGVVPRWVGCGPEPRPRIYFANHSSHLDGPTIWGTLPRSLRRLTRPVAAHDYWTASRFRRYLATQVFNAVLVERKNPTPRNNPLDHMLAAMGAESSLIVFPEGTRFHNPEPAEFKPGLYYLAKRRPDLELVPVLLDNLNRILPKGELLPVPLIGSVTFGAPIRLEEHEGRDQFLTRARQSVIDLRTNR